MTINEGSTKLEQIRQINNFEERVVALKTLLKECANDPDGPRHEALTLLLSYEQARSSFWPENIIPLVEIAKAYRPWIKDEVYQGIVNRAGTCMWEQIMLLSVSPSMEWQEVLIRIGEILSFEADLACMSERVKAGLHGLLRERLKQSLRAREANPAAEAISQGPKHSRWQLTVEAIAEIMQQLQHLGLEDFVQVRFITYGRLFVALDQAARQELIWLKQFEPAAAATLGIELIRAWYYCYHGFGADGMKPPGLARAQKELLDEAVERYGSGEDKGVLDHWRNEIVSHWRFD